MFFHEHYLRIPWLKGFILIERQNWKCYDSFCSSTWSFPSLYGFIEMNRNKNKGDIKKWVGRGRNNPIYISFQGAVKSSH